MGAISKSRNSPIVPKCEFLKWWYHYSSWKCAEYTYPHFQNSQEFALDGGVIFDTLANSDESHADEVFISALKCSIWVLRLK